MTRTGDLVPVTGGTGFVVRVFALVDLSVAQVVPEPGEVKDMSSEKARRVPGWSPRPAGEAVVATGESLVRLGLVRR